MEPSWMEVKEEVDLESPFRFEGLRGKVRFSFAEIKVLLEEVKNHRFVVLKKFNAGVSSETKKQTWSEITDKVNSLGVTVREVRQIMKKWADLKCDARRRMLAMRAPKGHKKTLGPVEVMVQKILLLAPGKDEAELDVGSIEEISPRRPRAKPRGRPRRHSLSSPKEEPVEEFYQSSPEMSFDLIHDETMPLDFDEQDELLPDVKHVSYSSSPSYAPFPPAPPSPYPSSSNGTASFHPSPCSSSVMPPPILLPPPPPPRQAPPPQPPSSSSTSSSSLSSAPPPPPAPRPPSPPGGGARDRLARVAAQSLQQQQVSGALLGSVSRSLELLASAVQQLVETQQDFITESLGQQRHTLDILKDFSHNALALLRDRPPAAAHAKHPPSPASVPPSGPPGGAPSAPTTSTLPAPVPEPEPEPEPESETVPGPEIPTGPEQHNLEPQEDETQNVDLEKQTMDYPELQEPGLREPGLRDPEPQEPGLSDPEPREPGLRDPEPREPGLSDPEPQTPQPMEVQDTQPRTPGEPKPGSPDPDGP